MFHRRPLSLRKGICTSSLPLFPPLLLLLPNEGNANLTVRVLKTFTGLGGWDPRGRSSHTLRMASLFFPQKEQNSVLSFPFSSLFFSAALGAWHAHLFVVGWLGLRFGFSHQSQWRLSWASGLSHILQLSLSECSALRIQVQDQPIE